MVSIDNFIKKNRDNNITLVCYNVGSAISALHPIYV